MWSYEGMRCKFMITTQLDFTGLWTARCKYIIIGICINLGRAFYTYK
jgi:hypothetical protein